MTRADAGSELTNGGRLKTAKPSEDRCHTCKARITRLKSDGLEVGHKYGCPERPDELPDGWGSGGSYYDGGADDDHEASFDGGEQP